MNRIAQAHVTFTVLASCLLTLMSVSTVHAANECALEYTFDADPGAATVTRRVMLNLNEGETKTLNQAAFLTARNLKAHPLQIYYSDNPPAKGVALPFVSLTQNQHVPVTGTFATSKYSLYIVKCNAVATIARPPTAVTPGNVNQQRLNVPVQAPIQK